MNIVDKSKEQLIEELAEIRRHITQVEEAREQLACNVASCQEALAKDQAVVSAFHGVMYVCSSTYEIEFVNERGLQRTGYDPVGEKWYWAIHSLEVMCPWCG
ncbi:MAG: hypothetical protein WC647_16380 [Desulfomonilaceae bacterium]|jgi:hypothetical protein